MASKRVQLAQHMAESDNNVGFITAQWLRVFYALECEGYQVVKTSETAEYNGLRVADEGED